MFTVYYHKFNISENDDWEQYGGMTEVPTRNERFSYSLYFRKDFSEISHEQVESVRVYMPIQKLQFIDYHEFITELCFYFSKSFKSYIGKGYWIDHSETYEDEMRFFEFKGKNRTIKEMISKPCIDLLDYTRERMGEYVLSVEIFTTTGQSYLIFIE